RLPARHRRATRLSAVPFRPSLRFRHRKHTMTLETFRNFNNRPRRQVRCRGTALLCPSWRLGWLLTLVLLVTLSTASFIPAQNPPAFPGAQGGGAASKGGRGGEVCEVTTLDDAGPGSFRDCLARKGPRTVVFRVAGRINLKTGIRVMNP